MTLSCAKIQHHKDGTHFSQKQVEPGLNIPEKLGEIRSLLPEGIHTHVMALRATASKAS